MSYTGFLDAWEKQFSSSEQQLAAGQLQSQCLQGERVQGEGGSALTTFLFL